MWTKLAIASGLLLLAAGSGFWLSHAGKPLNQLILTIHKLIAVGMVVIAVLAVIQWFHTAPLHTITLVLLVIIGVLVVTLFASGAILSQGKPTPGPVLTLHQTASLLTMVATAIVIWGPK